MAGGQDQQYALSVNGDVVRDTWFLRSSWLRNITSSATPRSLTGYATREVDDLLGRVAAELDAGRPAGSLIENATFRRMHNRLLPGDMTSTPSTGSLTSSFGSRTTLSWLE